MVTVAEAVEVRSTEASAHARSVRVDIAGVATFLGENLGTTLTAFIAGVEKKTVQRCAHGESQPRPQVEQRLRAAFQIFTLVAAADSPHTVRAWFTGMNPQLDDLSPAEALAQGDDRAVMAAARAYLAGG
jgi:hypothetical protein